MTAPIFLIIVIMFILDTTVSLLNVSYRKKPLPENVKDLYDEAKYKKWLGYTMDKLSLELIGKTISTILMIGLLVFGFFPALEQFTQTLSSDLTFQSLVFVALFMGIHVILGLPFDWIDTFRIEAKYGFNKTSVKIFWLDQLKGLILGGLLTSVLVTLLSVLYLTFKDSLMTFIVGLWALVSVLMIVLFILNTKVFVRLFNKLQPLEDGSLKDKIHALSVKAGFEVKAIFVMDASKRSTKLNAFFSGLGKTREVVLFDTLRAKMNDDQILGVLAHELGHAKHRDTLRMLVIQILVLGVYALGLGLVLSSPSLYEQFGLSQIHPGFAVVLFSVLIEPVSLLIGIPVNALSRSAEYKADAYAVSMTSKETLSEVMRILAQENLANLNPHPLTVLLRYTHPPLSLRLKAIAKSPKAK